MAGDSRPISAQTEGMSTVFKTLDGTADLINTHTATAKYLEKIDMRGYHRLISGVIVPRTWMQNRPPWVVAKEQVHAIGKATPRAVVSGISAALWLDLHVLETPKKVELTLPGDSGFPPRTSWPPEVTYRAGYLPAGEMQVSRGIRTTTMPRTIFDIARYQGMMAAVVTLDHAYRNRWVNRRTLLLYTETKKGRKGSVAFRETIALADGSSESPGESVLRVQLRQSKDPAIKTVEPQARIGTYRVDLLVNGHVVVEFDGKHKYGVDGQDAGQQIIAEKQRHNDLERRGYRVVRVTWDELLDEANGVSAAVKRVLLEVKR
ncbi:Uncharacterised protein [Corynebacterium renale]|uniref:Very-short-patch-repair endonuclease n=2 Tax=Corynebacterium renale TaxID=1724 RepID=A0A2A9DLR6_9CORY|nr:very-short-patch-repair endonuclease [Corynebacterium renale]SQI22339.1 Uncharacterised protein [Corynebacterium renale]